MPELSLVKAINLALRDAMRADERVLMTGEDVGRLGGVFRATEGLLDEFGDKRVLDSPLAESGIVGTAIGLALKGFRSVVEIQFDGFVFPAFDQLVTQLARIRYRSHGAKPMPVVVRIPFGGHIGAIEHHSESPEGYFIATPGLNVAAPSNPHDAYWMLRQAIESDDPVIFFEPKSRYQTKGTVELDAPGRGLRDAAVVREGSDLTIVTYGAAVPICLDAAAEAAADDMSLEVIDLRSLSPLDWPTIFASVRKTNRLVIVHEAPRTLGLGAEIAARVSEEMFYELEAPVARVTGYDIPFPPSTLEADYLPNIDRILDAVDAAMAH